jgi:type II secretory ATPase GspE/PulE/Tfp pilus assembly ATPase PilB-like protein
MGDHRHQDLDQEECHFLRSGQAGVADGMSTLKQDGIRKIIDGITTIREVRRVCVD